MEIAVRIVQLILSLSILVICHEFGHFFFAKLFKTRVEKFYLFFDPWFSLFKIKRGQTEYGIGWLPLGGYVKIAGMIDESMDTEQMKQPPQPWEFRSKPAWQRLIIMIAGVTVNVLLAMFIYAMMSFTWGTEYLPASNLKYGIAVDSVGYQMGLRDGDMIVKVNGNPTEDYNKILPDLLLNDPKTLTVTRNGDSIELNIKDQHISKILNGETPAFSPRIPFEIEEFAPESAAKNAGFEKGDKLLEINGEQTAYFHQVKKFLNNHKSQNVQAKVLRGSDTITIPIEIPETGLIGVMTKSYGSFFEFKTQEYGFFESFPVGISKGVEKIKEYVKQWKLIFNPETKAYKSLGSFISMAKIFPGVWNWQAFWSLTAFLSIMLAVLNIVPIPGLDGGHVMFLIYEIIVGKKPSDKFMEIAQIVGMVFLILLMVVALGNDLIRHVF